MRQVAQVIPLKRETMAQDHKSSVGQTVQSEREQRSPIRVRAQNAHSDSGLSVDTAIDTNERQRNGPRPQGSLGLNDGHTVSNTESGNSSAILRERTPSTAAHDSEIGENTLQFISSTGNISANVTADISGIVQHTPQGFTNTYRLSHPDRQQDNIANREDNSEYVEEASGFVVEQETVSQSQAREARIPCRRSLHQEFDDSAPQSLSGQAIDLSKRNFVNQTAAVRQSPSVNRSQPQTPGEGHRLHKQEEWVTSSTQSHSTTPNRRHNLQRDQEPEQQRQQQEQQRKQQQQQCLQQQGQATTSVRSTNSSRQVDSTRGTVTKSVLALRSTIQAISSEQDKLTEAYVDSSDEEAAQAYWDSGSWDVRKPDVRDVPKPRQDVQNSADKRSIDMVISPEDMGHKIRRKLSSLSKSSFSSTHSLSDIESDGEGGGKNEESFSNRQNVIENTPWIQERLAQKVQRDGSNEHRKGNKNLTQVAVRNERNSNSENLKPNESLAETVKRMKSSGKSDRSNDRSSKSLTQTVDMNERKSNLVNLGDIERQPQIMDRGRSSKSQTKDVNQSLTDYERKRSASDEDYKAGNSNTPKRSFDKLTTAASRSPPLLVNKHKKTPKQREIDMSVYSGRQNYNQQRTFDDRYKGDERTIKQGKSEVTLAFSGSPYRKCIDKDDSKQDIQFESKTCAQTDSQSLDTGSHNGYTSHKGCASRDVWATVCTKSMNRTCKSAIHTDSYGHLDTDRTVETESKSHQHTISGSSVWTAKDTSVQRISNAYVEKETTSSVPGRDRSSQDRNTKGGTENTGQKFPEEEPSVVKDVRRAMSWKKQTQIEVPELEDQYVSTEVLEERSLQLLSSNNSNSAKKDSKLVQGYKRSRKLDDGPCVKKFELSAECSNEYTETEATRESKSNKGQSKSAERPSKRRKTSPCTYRAVTSEDSPFAQRFELSERNEEYTETEASTECKSNMQHSSEGSRKRRKMLTYKCLSEDNLFAEKVEELEEIESSEESKSSMEQSNSSDKQRKRRKKFELLDEQNDEYEETRASRESKSNIEESNSSERPRKKRKTSLEAIVVSSGAESDNSVCSGFMQIDTVQLKKYSKQNQKRLQKEHSKATEMKSPMRNKRQHSKIYDFVASPTTPVKKTKRKYTKRKTTEVSKPGKRRTLNVPQCQNTDPSPQSSPRSVSSASNVSSNPGTKQKPIKSSSPYKKRPTRTSKTATQSHTSPRQSNRVLNCIKQVAKDNKSSGFDDLLLDSEEETWSSEMLKQANKNLPKVHTKRKTKVHKVSGKAQGKTAQKKTASRSSTFSSMQQSTPKSSTCGASMQRRNVKKTSASGTKTEFESLGKMPDKNEEDLMECHDKYSEQVS